LSGPFGAKTTISATSKRAPAGWLCGGRAKAHVSFSSFDLNKMQIK
jgi:hypothetical protein